MITQDKWSTSRQLLQRSSRSLTGGVSSPFRAKAPVPLFFEDGFGCRLRDVDGNTYIDYCLAWGPNILGYRHPAIVDAVKQAADGPHTYGAQHRLEYEVAEQIQRMVPCAERIAFTSSGSEAVQCAMRLARACTGRNLIVKFEGHYHGWMDSALISYHPTAGEIGPPEQPRPALGSRGQVSNVVENTVPVRWNDIAALERTLEEHSGRVAALIMEAVLCNSGCLLSLPGYLVKVRELCTRHGILLIFDEVITGFRMSAGGAQAAYGVTPDIATFGKALGGGLPLSAIAGSAGIMDEMCNGVVFGGTFNGNPLSLAACKAVLGVLSRDGGAPLAAVNHNGETLMAGIRSIASERGIPLQVTGFGGAFSLHFTERTGMREYRDTLHDDRARLTRFLALALAEGLNLLPDGRWYTSTAHTKADLADTLDAVRRAFQALE